MKQTRQNTPWNIANKFLPLKEVWCTISRGEGKTEIIIDSSPDRKQPPLVGANKRSARGAIIAPTSAQTAAVVSFAQEVVMSPFDWF